MNKNLKIVAYSFVLLFSNCLIEYKNINIIKPINKNYCIASTQSNDLKGLWKTGTIIYPDISPNDSIINWLCVYKNPNKFYVEGEFIFFYKAKKRKKYEFKIFHKVDEHILFESTFNDSISFFKYCEKINVSDSIMKW